MIENLDIQCARLGEQLAEKANKERENLLTAGLGVLQEQGVYAFFLFLKTRGNGDVVSAACETFLREQGLLPGESGDCFDGIKSLAGNLDDLILARELLMQALTYGRYHAKAGTEGANRK